MACFPLLSVREQELSIILKGSMLLSIETAKIKNEWGSVYLLGNVCLTLHLSVFPEQSACTPLNSPHYTLAAGEALPHPSAGNGLWLLGGL